MPVTPIFPVIGSKARMSPRIAEAVRPITFDVYVEPFVGSGSIYLGLYAAGLIPDHAVVVLNDCQATPRFTS